MTKIKVIELFAGIRAQREALRRAGIEHEVVAISKIDKYVLKAYEFSDKECSKVYRSAAYYARYVAKNILTSGLARKCEIQVVYAIGVAKPVSLYVDTFSTGRIDDEEFEEIVLKFFNFSPKAIRTEIINDSVCFQILAEYGHVGREDIDVPWETTNKAYILKAYVR